VTNGYDLAMGTSRMFTNDHGWLILNCVTFCLAILQLVYAMAMKSRGVLR
jgi:hypothetical protein